MSQTKFLTTQIEDQYVLQNFDRLNQLLLINNLLLVDFKHFEVTFPTAVTNFLFTHNLGYVPKDIIQTSKTGAGSITFNQDLATSTYLNITTTGACVVRFFAGTYVNEGL